MAAAGATYRPQVNIAAVHSNNYVAQDSLWGERIAVLAAIQGINVVLGSFLLPWLAPAVPQILRSALP